MDPLEQLHGYTGTITQTYWNYYMDALELLHELTGTTTWTR